MKYLIQSGPGIGDVLQVLSMARDIKFKDDNAIVDLLMGGDENRYRINQEIIMLQDNVNTIYRYSSKEMLINIETCLTLIKKRYDFGFVRIGKEEGRKSVWPLFIMKFSFIKKVVGYGHKIIDIPVNIVPRMHYLERNKKMLGVLGIEGQIDTRTLNITKINSEIINTIQKHRDKTKGVIALSIGTNPVYWRTKKESFLYDVKSWEYIKWNQLCDKLSKYNYLVLVLGGRKEAKEINEQHIVFRKTNNVLFLVGKTSLSESIGALYCADIAVGAEGGILHCAASVGTKTLTIVGGSDIYMWNPGGPHGEYVKSELECAPCIHKKKGAYCTNHECLSRISVEHVFERIEDIIRRGIE